jgi:hypothetical protein
MSTAGNAANEDIMIKFVDRRVERRTLYLQDRDAPPGEILARGNNDKKFLKSSLMRTLYTFLLTTNQLFVFVTLAQL